MARFGGRQRLAMAMVCAFSAAATMGSHRAEAFELKHTSTGQSLRWARSQVSYVIDPSVAEAVPGGAEAVSTAVGSWGHAAGVPTLSTSAGSRIAKPTRWRSR
jgi:hypothetical protein